MKRTYKAPQNYVLLIFFSFNREWGASLGHGYKNVLVWGQNTSSKLLILPFVFYNIHFCFSVMDYSLLESYASFAFQSWPVTVMANINSAEFNLEKFYLLKKNCTMWELELNFNLLGRQNEGCCLGDRVSDSSEKPLPGGEGRS